MIEKKRSKKGEEYAQVLSYAKWISNRSEREWSGVGDGVG